MAAHHALPPRLSLWDWLTKPHDSIQGVEPQRQARLLSSLLLVLTVLSVVIVPILSVFINPINPIAWGSVLFLVSLSRYFKVAAVFAVFVNTVIVLSNVPTSTRVSEILPFVLGSMLICSLLFSRTATAVIGGVHLILLAILPAMTDNVALDQVVF